jgi:hypothetical protein
MSVFRPLAGWPTWVWVWRRWRVLLVLQGYYWPHVRVWRSAL